MAVTVSVAAESPAEPAEQEDDKDNYKISPNDMVSAPFALRENYLLALVRASLQKKPGFVCRVFGISNAEGSTFEYAPARARTMD